MIYMITRVIIRVANKNHEIVVMCIEQHVQVLDFCMNNQLVVNEAEVNKVNW